MSTPEKLLAKLERAANGLRWWLWVDRNQASIYCHEGKWHVSAEIKGRYVSGEGKSLTAAMEEIDMKLRANAIDRRLSRFFEAQKQPKKEEGKA
jgi:hypothetical protein